MSLDIILIIIITFSLFGAWGAIFWIVAVPALKKLIEQMFDKGE